MPEFDLCRSLMQNIGRTVTIFTTSGGLSGAGFTGVLASVCDGVVRLITDIGAAPSCPVGSCCTGPIGNWGGFGGDGFGRGGGGFGGGGFSCGIGPGCNWLGSVTEIPICKIASFTHNAI